MKTRVGLMMIGVGALSAAALARPSIAVHPVFDLENEMFLQSTLSSSLQESSRFEGPGRWISRPPAAMQQPIPVPPLSPDVTRRPGGPLYGIGEPGFPTLPPPGPGGGDPNGPGGPGTVIPMPTSFGLGVSGLLALAGATRRRRA